MDPAILDLEDAERPEEVDDDAADKSVLARYTGYIRKRFPAIRSVGCWMTLAGYWDGIHPDGRIAAGLSAPLRRVRVEDPFRSASRDWFVQATELDMPLFWDRAFHSLREGGVDFVKIDAQAEWEWIQDDARPYPAAGHHHARTFGAAALGKAAFEAMEGAATRYFGAAGGGVIHSIDTHQHAPNALESQGTTIRCTDDFFPHITEAHRHHLAHNVYNALLLPRHQCDADMLSYCSGGNSVDGCDYTGLHASFRAFTDARLWVSDKADAPPHDALRALVAPPTLSNEGTGVRVQASGSLIAGSTFNDLISDAVGPALKMAVQHESTASATVGLWNLRASADTFDLLQLKQMLSPQDNADQVASTLYTRYAVRSFRSGRIWLLSSEADVEEGALGVTLPAGSWEVPTVSPLLTTMVEGVSVALLGATQHFMTPGGVAAITIATAYPDKDGRRRSYQSRRPSHQRRRSTRSASSASSASLDESALTTVADTLLQRTGSGARAVLLSLALVNGFFAVLHTTITGVIRTPRNGNTRVAKSKTARVDFVETVIGVLDKLQTLVVFGLLVLASWTSTLPRTWVSSGPSLGLPFRSSRPARRQDAILDNTALRRVRLASADAVATLKRCLTARTIGPLRECPVSLTTLPPSTVKSPLSSPLPETPRTPTLPDVLVTALVDIAAPISFLVLCTNRDSIKACKIDRTRYHPHATPWIRVEEVHVEQRSEKAFCVEVDVKAWKEGLDETLLQTLSAPVCVSLRISA